MITDESQHGEYTKVIRPFFRDLQLPLVTFAVELGSHGKENSNTWNLVKQDGWRALWVDGSSRAIAQAFKDAEGDNRITVVQALLGAGHEDGRTGEIFIHDTIGHDSVRHDWKPETGGKGASEFGTFTRTGRVICEALDRPWSPRDMRRGEDVPDIGLLSIDLEGADEVILLDILQCGFKPQLICMERQDGNMVLDLREYHYNYLTRVGVNDFWMWDPLRYRS